MSDKTKMYDGHCYCGASRVSVVGEPIVMAHCHCHSCSKWHSAPVNAWCLWPEDKFVVAGSTIQSKKNNESNRISCSKCGGALANIKPGKEVVAVYAMTLTESDFRFLPIGHICYEERVFDTADGLPKWKTVPESFGGNGAIIAEPEKTGWISQNSRAAR